MSFLTILFALLGFTVPEATGVAGDLEPENQNETQAEIGGMIIVGG